MACCSCSRPSSHRGRSSTTRGSAPRPTLAIRRVLTLAALGGGALLVNFMLLGTAGVAADAGVLVAAVGVAAAVGAVASCCGSCEDEAAAPCRALAAAIHVPTRLPASRPRRRASHHPTALSFGPDQPALRRGGRRQGRLRLARHRAAAPVRPRPDRPARPALARADALRLGERQGRGAARRRSAPRRLRGLPYGRHQQDAIVAGPDGRLYLGSGSTCDCVRRERSAERRDPLLPARRQRPARRRDRPAQSVRARVRERQPLRDGERPGRPRQERAGRDGRAHQTRRRLTAGRAAGRLRACAG